MVIFKKKEKSKVKEVVEVKKAEEKPAAFMNYGVDFMKNRMEAYMDEELNLSYCMDAILDGTKITEERVTETSNVIEVIDKNYDDFRGLASDIRNLMEESDRKIENSDQSMTKLTDQMNDSKIQLSSMHSTFAKVEEDFNKISSLTTDIAKISSGTNLLALNASIEAARAGEAGNGFAVVAAQIRELSSSTDELVHGIDDSIQALRERLMDLQAEIDKTTTLIQDNIESSGGLKESIEGVKECTDRVKRVSDGIICSIEKNSSQISKALKSLDNIHSATEKINTEVDNLTRKSSEKTTMLCQMEDLLKQFGNTF
ncbi:MAG: hypothetical protein IKL07_06400 [Clostridium sp.]|nr:hypothetical protein [Clostridium sp.]